MKRRFWKRVKVVAYDCTEAGCSETTFLKNAELPTLIELREGDVVLSKDEVDKIRIAIGSDCRRECESALEILDRKPQ